MLQPWWRRNQSHPPKSPFVRLAAYPQETTAALIALLFLIFSATTATSIISHHIIFGIGLALAFGLQLMGHIAEFIRLRRYMPHIVTAILTLPYYVWLCVLAIQVGYSPGTLLLATCGMGIFGLFLLLLAHASSTTISKWLGVTSKNKR